MAAAQATPPIAFNRLKQIANDACHSALGSVETYDHSKTDQWNQTIINSILKAVISESTPAGAASPSYKFAVNSTIVQHLVPTSQLNKSKGTTTASTSTDAATATTTDEKTASTTATATDGKPHVGRRGMHSATGAYWNEKTDGMWSYKYEGDGGRGLDVVLMIIWIAL